MAIGDLTVVGSNLTGISCSGNYHGEFTGDLVKPVKNEQVLLADLKNIIGNPGDTVYMTGRTSPGDGDDGTFYWDSSDLSAKVATDTLSDIYVAPNIDLTGASGGWVRQLISATQAEMEAGTETALRSMSPLLVRQAIDAQMPNNIIGAPGEAGFGVGIAPASAVPEGMTYLGTSFLLGDNYGNYQFSDGSIMCYVPKFYYRIAHVSNPTYATYGVNSCDVKGVNTFATTADANAAGYALHRAFIDGGTEKDGFFVDKYMCSKNALGSGFVASSLQNGLPISTNNTHNPIAALTACADNYNYEAINAAHARDGIDGAINPDSIFFCNSRQIHGALALLSLAHGQKSLNTTNCAWYDATYNFPKGCNNNALGDANDATIAYTSDGFDNCGKTGSGTPFAKTTHNGQACGVADLNGLMYEVNIGLTCIATTKTITAITQANPCQVTVVGHGLTTGDYVLIGSLAGMTELRNKIYKVTVVDANNFTLYGVNSTAFSAYIGGGTAIIGTFYRAADSTEMRNFTAGNTLATDHWGVTGVTAMMTPFVPAFAATYPSNNSTQRFGSSAEQVIASNVSGDAWEMAGLGFPRQTAISQVGTNLFGVDYYYQYVRHDLCPASSHFWQNLTLAGIWSFDFTSYRTTSSNIFGFRTACYPA